MVRNLSTKFISMADSGSAVDELKVRSVVSTRSCERLFVIGTHMEAQSLGVLGMLYKVLFRWHARGVEGVLSVVDNGDVARCMFPYVKFHAFWKEGRQVAVQEGESLGEWLGFLLWTHARVEGL